MFSEQIHSPLQKLSDRLFDEKEVEVWMKRDDLIHSDISGNKWRKLKYNLIKAQSLGKELIITFGGAYSNHIAATAALGNLYGIKTKGIIRGEELQGDNPTLEHAINNGMEFEFVSRDYYRERNEDWFKNEVLERHANAFLIPEGGANFYGVQGCIEIPKEIGIDFDTIFTAAGTGTTASGIALGIESSQHLYVVSALKGGFLLNDMEQLLLQVVLNTDFVSDLMDRITLLTDYHFGGYAKTNEHLIKFMRRFYAENQIKLDHIYTAKMMWALNDLIEKDHFKKGHKIVVLHTGGLQGIKGFELRSGQIIYS